MTDLLDLRGPAFLALYVALLAGASAVALLLRHVMRPPAADADVPLRLPALHAAYLAGGRNHAVDAAVAALVRRELVAVSATSRTLSATKAAPRDLDELEQHVHRVISTTATMDGVRRAAGARFDTLRPLLDQLGLLIPEADAWRPRVLPAVVLGGVLLLGVAKMAVGASRGRPVGFLFVLVVVTAVEALWFLSHAPWRSQLGDRALKVLRKRNAALEQTACVMPERVAPAELALAVGLFGAVAVRSGPLAPLGQLLAPPREPRTGDGSSGGGCSSCSGGCGGGGGGCGGCGS